MAKHLYAGLFILELLCVSALAEVPAQSRIQRAVASIRSIKLGESAYVAEVARQRAESAWKLIRKEGKAAVPVLLQILRDERDDDFLVLSLSAFTLRLSPSLDTMQEVSSILVRADPGASPDAFFEVVSFMAAEHCQACMPAVLKILELKQLDISRPKLRRRVGIIHARVLTLCQYGDIAIPAVIEHLTSCDCTVRANAAAVSGDLQPTAIPPALTSIALDDRCSAARADALQALALLRYPKIESLARQMSTAGGFPANTDEKEALISAFMIADTETSKASLREYARDTDPNIAAWADEALEFTDPYKALTPGSDPHGWQVRVHRELEKAAKNGRFRLKTEKTSLFTALTAEDIPLLNRARAAVLHGVSDDGLDEWYRLTSVISALRAHRPPAGNP